MIESTEAPPGVGPGGPLPTTQHRRPHLAVVCSPDVLDKALARRMGVQEIIWDCGYWSQGSTEFHGLDECYDDRGHRRKRIDDLHPRVGG